MSERMNKEKAREELRDRKILAEIEYNQSEDAKRKDNLLRYIQALDIAIESLEQNIETIRVEREFDISELDKGTDYLLTKMTEDFVREFVKANVLEMIASETRDIHKTKAIFEVKVVEPYERKE